MRTGRYISEEHRECVMAVLVAKGKAAREKRTRNLVAHSVGRGTVREDRLAELDARVRAAESEVKKAKLIYEQFVTKHDRELIAHWKAEELFDGEE